MERDLRGPTGAPDEDGFVGRGHDIASLLRRMPADPLARPSRPYVVVLHGPAGVGKTALAGQVVRRYSRRFERASDPFPVHWLSLGGTVDVEGVLLRLLAECGAPRRPIVQAALDRDREFGRELRRQCVAHISHRVVVLDDVRPSDVRPLLEVFRRFTKLTVIVTSRQKRGWKGVDRLYEVGPLEARDAAELFARYSTAPTGQVVDVPPATRGLPPLVRIAGALAHEVSREQLWAARGPEALVGLALNLCTPEERLLLCDLASRPSRAPFTSWTIWPLDRRAGIGGMVRRELVQRWREADDVFRLPAPVADVMVGTARADEVALEPAGAVGRILQDTASVLDGRPRLLSDDKPRDVRTPRELVPHIDEFVRLHAEARKLRATPLDALLTDSFAPVLAFLGDAHRLVALYRRSKKNDAVRRALCSLARDVGLPDIARSLVDGATGPDARHERAMNHHQVGELDSALAALGPEPETEDIHTAWNLLVRGAVLCDQGKVEEAARNLRFSADLHQAFDCRRGRGWALLHLARVSLLRGLNAVAELLLSEAEEALSAVGDVRGQNWVATERVRLLTQRGALKAAHETAQRTISAHAATEDVRGMGWTHYWLGRRTYATADAIDIGRAELAKAARRFTDCGDALGHAWSRHWWALLPPEYPPHRADDPVADWLDIHRAFVAAGCALGRAWTVLEIAARVPGGVMSRAFRSNAESDFGQLGDVGGLTWVRALEVVRSHAPGPSDHEHLAASLPADVPWVGQLLTDVAAFWSQGAPHVIPPGARILVLTSSPDLMEFGTSPNGPRCRVRITLLDESPTAGTTARLLVRVAPEPGHPWAAGVGAAPWLTATALPLTRASVEPPSGHLRPSELDAHGAEFDFTPHRTGTHRIRFTIALDSSGTVLQQVETELDILDHDQPGSHTAPHAATPRGR